MYVFDPNADLFIINVKGLLFMTQSPYKSNSELKFLARMQTGRYFGILIGAILLNFILSTAIVNVVSLIIPVGTVAGYVLNYILVFIAQIACSILNVGIACIFLKSACNMPGTITDLFCGFKQNSIKALKIGAIITTIESICLLPFEFASLHIVDIWNSIPLFSEYNVNDLSMMISNGSINSYELLEAYSILSSAMLKYYLIMFVCIVISSVLTLPFFPAFYMVIDFPDWDTATILRRCFEVMQGNKLRLFVLYLSFIPLFLLSVFTCGLALIWLIPYMKMTATNFYLDIMAVRNKTVIN